MHAKNPIFSILLQTLLASPRAALRRGNRRMRAEVSKASVYVPLNSEGLRITRKTDAPAFRNA